METFGDRLKAARTRKGMMQKDVAAVLDCAPTSLTNWENGKIEPSMEVLSRLCEVLEVQPLDLLDRRYTFVDIVAIAQMPGHERTYQEKVALNFSGSLLEKLLPASKQREETERVKARAAFIKDNNLLERFGGTLTGDEIDAIMAEYQEEAAINADILFAFHVLTNRRKWTVIDTLQGLLSRRDNLLPLAANMEAAAQYTINSTADYPGGLNYIMEGVN